jgi:hypothetical protein
MPTAAVGGRDSMIHVTHPSVCDLRAFSFSSAEANWCDHHTGHTIVILRNYLGLSKQCG